MSDNNLFRSNGKLLISGEYVVLHGARALAVPLQFGQTMQIGKTTNALFEWKSYYNRQCWFEARFDSGLQTIDTTDHEKATIIASILRQALTLAGIQPSTLMGITATYVLEFDPQWGWGSSSTLINNLAQWLHIDAYELSRTTLGGSNYDVACAKSSSPIFYKRDGHLPIVEDAPFVPPFSDQLYFIYLGRKQDSRLSVNHLTRKNVPEPELIAEIDHIGEEMCNCANLHTFGRLMKQHEELVSTLIGLEPVKSRLFPDFDGQVKSLGAWGGDFVMAATDMPYQETLRYFATKGHTTLFRFHEIVLNKA